TCQRPYGTRATIPLFRGYAASGRGTGRRIAAGYACRFLGSTMIFDEPDGATPLDPDEIAGLKFDHITTRGELDELEQANITQGLRWLGRRRGGDVLSDEFIRQLHVRLFGDVWRWAGT